MAMESWLSKTELRSDDLWIETGLFPGMLSLDRRERGLGLADAASNQATQLEEADFLDWEEAGKRREVNSLKRLVKTAEESVLRRSQDLYEKKEQEQWAEKHDLWLKELVGSRNLGGSYVDKSLAVALLGDSDRPSLPHYVDSFQPTSNAMTYQPCDPNVVRSHFEIIKSHKGDVAFSVEARDLAKRADSVSLPGGSCYASALRLVSRILSRQNFSQEEIAFSTLSHFSNQFDQWLSGKVRQSGMEGQKPGNSFTSPKANTVARFVTLQLGAGAEASLWPCLYYCLRIGDAVAAKEVFECTSTPNENEETRAAMANILTSLSQRQGSAQTLWDVSGGSFNPRKQDTRTIAEASLTEGTDQRMSVYRSGVLTLLGCSADFPTSGLPGLSTIEDYLFGRTVIALFHDEPVQQLEALKKQISQLGAEYFEDGEKESGGWSYCLPLLASQQFRTALTYLAKAGGQIGKLQATHLALFLSKGIPRSILEKSESSVTEDFVTSLLVEYATWLDGHANFGAVCALEYLKYIPTRPVLMSELVSLLVRTPDFNVLAGSLSSEGVGRRGKGALDAHFSADDISFLLQKAAEKCFHDAKNDRNRLLRATNLFMLSGHFRSLTEMVCSLMLPNNGIPNEENQFWFQQLQLFYSNFLTRRTYVVEVDESLPAICKQLLDIFEVYRRIQIGHHTEAWSTIDRLAIIPLSQSDVAASKDRYKGLDPLFKKQVPMLLQVAMRSLRYKHEELKNQPATANALTLKQLKDRARAILTFAGMISEDAIVQIDVMAQMEASMI